MSLPLAEIFVGVITLVLVYISYDKYLKSQRDIHELALQEQSNISPSRKSDETAIYRNNLVPHEMPLVTGLQIRQGFKLRDGNIRDVWSVVMHQKLSKFTFISDEGVNTMSVSQLNSATKQFHSWLQLENVKVVGSCLPNGSVQGFVTALTCFVNGITLHSFDQVPRSQQPDVEVLIITKQQLPFAKRLSFKQLIVVPYIETQEEGVVNWDSIVDISKSDEVFEYKYQPSYDQGTPLINSIGTKTHSFTHQNFVSAASSLVKTIPLGHEFSSKDVLLINDFTNQVHCWSKIFALVLFGGSIILNNDNSQTPLLELIETHSPTILNITPSTAKNILSTLKKDLSIFQNLKVSRAQQLLSDGIFTHQAQLPQLSPIRLIYITTNDASTIETTLSSSHLTLLRALSGARIINERTLPQLSGPLTSTNFYDYRIFSNPRLNNRGTASLSLEIKLFKKEGMDIEKKKGELCVRGFIVGRPTDKKDLERAINEGERVGSEGWMPTGITGTFGRDGCLYEL